MANIPTIYGDDWGMIYDCDTYITLKGVMMFVSMYQEFAIYIYTYYIV